VFMGMQEEPPTHITIMLFVPKGGAAEVKRAWGEGQMKRTHSKIMLAGPWSALKVMPLPTLTELENAELTGPYMLPNVTSRGL
jgi:hypothetical protein